MSARAASAVTWRLRRNAAWNLVGFVLPVLLAVAAVPLLVDGLGVDRFGVLSLAWVLIGYFSILDLGLGRAITQRIAVARVTGDDEQTPAQVWSLLWLIAALGTALGALLLGLASVATEALNVPAELEAEVHDALIVLAFAVPTVAATAALRGVLEGHAAFASVALGRVAIGVATVGGPLIVLPFSSSLVPVAAALAAARTLVLVLHGALAVRVDRRLLRPRAPRPSLLRPLIVPAGWMTVSNVLGPVLSNGDRFLIGAMLSTTAVAYYATPFDVVTKLTLIPAAISGVIFPAFAAFHAGGETRMTDVYGRVLRMTAAVVLVPSLVAAAFAHELLGLWLGEPFADAASDVVRWLAIGVFANCLAFIPFSVVQGVGRPDLTGWLQLVELPLTVALVWWLTEAHGIEGTAVAWAIRAGVETVALLLLAHHVAPLPRLAPLAMLGGGAAILAAAGLAGPPAWVRALIVLVVAAGSAYVAVSMVRPASRGRSGSPVRGRS